jgi:hypothetical protein
MAGRGSDMGILPHIYIYHWPTNIEKHWETCTNNYEDLNIWGINNNKQQYLLNGILRGCQPFDMNRMPFGDAQTCCRDLSSQVLKLLRRFISHAMHMLCTCYAHAKAIQPPIIQISANMVCAEIEPPKNSCRLRWIMWNHDWNRH